MKNRLVFYIISAVMAIWAVTPIYTRAETVPESVVVAAREYLADRIQQAKEDTTFFSRRWYAEGVTDFSAISLGEPYAQYGWSSQAIRDFACSRLAEFGEGARLLNWAFPVFYQNVSIVTIHVRFAHGAWGVGGCTLAAGDRRDPISRAREQYPSERGYRVAVLSAGGMGSYVLLYQNEKLCKIALDGPDRLGITGLPTNSDGTGQLVPIDEARERLVDLARKSPEASPKTDRDRVKEE